LGICSEKACSTRLLIEAKPLSQAMKSRGRVESSFKTKIPSGPCKDTLLLTLSDLSKIACAKASSLLLRI
jgi:hypothetical protein